MKEQIYILVFIQMNVKSKLTPPPHHCEKFEDMYLFKKYIFSQKKFDIWPHFTIHLRHFISQRDKKKNSGRGRDVNTVLDFFNFTLIQHEILADENQRRVWISEIYITQSCCMTLYRMETIPKENILTSSNRPSLII